MTKKIKGLALNGWLNLDKPLGMSSNEAVQRVKRFLNPTKIGHGGTLDPFASGVLPLAIGEATKTVAYAMDGAKTYRAQVRFGSATTTDDREGEVISQSSVRPAEILIKKALHALSGQMIMQQPPIFSALKVEGRRAYDLARAGKEVGLQPRAVWCKSAQLMGFDGECAEIKLEVGKGFYVRSFARDLGEKLRTRAHLSGLERTHVGPFSIQMAISLDSFTTLDHRRAVAALLPLECVLDDIPALNLGQAEAWRLKMGLPVALVRRSFLGPMANLRDGQTVRARYGDRLIALCAYQRARLKVLRGFN